LDIRYYSLAKDNDLEPEGYVKIEDLMPGLKLEYVPIQGLVLSLGVREFVGRKMIVFDHDKNEQTSKDVKESFACLFEMECRF